MLNKDGVPSLELIKQYEIKKRKYTDGLNREILNELLKIKTKRK